MDPGAPVKKKAHFKRRDSYQQNHAKVRSLQEANFIPFNIADPDNFLDVIDEDMGVYTPYTPDDSPASPIVDN